MKEKIGFKLSTRLISLFLSLLLFFFAVPPIIYAEAAEAVKGEETEGETSVLNGSSEEKKEYSYDGELYEVVELREENAKHFHLADGSYVAAQYPNAVHISDGNGGWVDIDNTLYSIIGDITTADSRIKFARFINGSANLFTLHNGNTKIEMSLVGANKGVIGEVTNGSDAEEKTELGKMLSLEKLTSSVIYREILSGVDIEYIANGTGVKENIIIKEKAEGYSYIFELKLNGLTASLEEDGSVSLADGEGNLTYIIPAPVIYDAKGVSGKASYALESKGGNGKYILTVTADSEWMSSAERAFPVTLDPAVSTPTTRAADLYVDADNPNTSYGSASTLKVDSKKTAYWATGGIGFIPVNAYVTKATLSLTVAGDEADAYVGAYRVTSTWTGALTYNQTKNAQNPQGSFYENEMLSYCYVSETGKTYDFDITEAVRYWRDYPSKNYGIALKLISGNGTDFYSVHSSNESSLHPCVTAYYTSHIGIESYNSYSSHSIGGASGSIDLATGSLTFSIPMFSSSDSLMPYTPVLTYNSVYKNAAIVYGNANVPNGATIASLGFKWSMQQSVIKKAYVKPDGAEDFFFIWCDGDGTEHSFFELSGSDGEYIDDDGLQLTLLEKDGKITITSKDKTVYTFASISLSSSADIEGGWYLESITNNVGNMLTFESDSTYHRPQSITLDINTVSDYERFRFVYGVGSLPIAVYDPSTGRGVLLGYSNSYNGAETRGAWRYLVSVRYVNGSTEWSDADWSIYNPTDCLEKIELTYTENGEISSASAIISGEKTVYSYTGKKVTLIKEYSQTNVDGQIVTYSYGKNHTDVRTSGRNDIYGADDKISEEYSSDDIITRYVFDERGRAKNVYSRTYDGSEIFGSETYKYSEDELTKNSISEMSGAIESDPNYLYNGSFERYSNDTENALYAFDGWTSSSSVTSYTSSETAVKNGVKLSGGNSFVYQTVSLPKGVYTISFDYVSKHTADCSFYVSVSYEGENGTVILHNEELALNEHMTDKAHSPLTKRFSESFTVTEQEENKGLKIGFYFSSSGNASSDSAVYLDNVCLTKGTGTAEYSILEAGHFESINGLNSYLSLWSSPNSGWSIEGNSETFGKSLNINGNILSEKYVRQRIYEVNEETIKNWMRSGAEINSGVYTVSGFGKSDNAAVSSISRFALRVDIGYCSGYSTENGELKDINIDKVTIYIDFLPRCTDWQFVSESFSTALNLTLGEGEEAPEFKLGYIAYIDIGCDFSYQPSGATASFDNISVYERETSKIKSEYKEEYKTQILATPEYTEYYVYDNDDYLVRYANSKGYLIDYEYEEGFLISETYYDFYVTSEPAYGPQIDPYTVLQPYPYTASNPDGLITKTPRSRSDYNYNFMGLIHETETYTEFADGTNEKADDAKVIATDTGYYYTQALLGAVRYEEDSLGNRVNYYYELTATGMKAAAIDAESKTGTAVYTDAWGNVEKILPVIDADFNSSQYTVETDAESVEYKYNAKNQLSEIITESTTYRLSYDTYGKLTEVKAGGSVIEKYDYNPNNGKLVKIIYQNGLTVEYVYDSLENLSEVCYNENGTKTTVFRYHYTTDGRLHKTEDLVAGTAVVYNYDESGRPTLVTAYDADDMKTDVALRAEYDEVGNLSNYYLGFAYVASNNYNDLFVSHSYTYSNKMLSKETINLINNVTATVDYTYDSFNRLTNKSFTYPISSNSSFTVSSSYTFVEDGENTSAKIDSYTSTVNNVSTEYSYTYDSQGNITSISVGGYIRQRFEYDNLGQLVREDNVPNNKTYIFTYDNAGNILSRKEYALTDAGVEPDGTFTEKKYTYSDGNWGDMLTSYNGNSITYDEIGNPLQYHNGFNSIDIP